MSKSDPESAPDEVSADIAAIGRALRSIPVSLLSDTITGLLAATKQERKSVVVPDPDPCKPGKRSDSLVELPDWPTRLRTVELVVAHRMGAPGTRKPIEPAKQGDDSKPAPGVLRVKGAGKAGG